MLRSQFRGGQSLLLRPKTVSPASGEHRRVHTVRAGLRRWQGKMEWRRREGEVEQRAMAGNGFVSDGDKENQSTSSQEVTSRVEDTDAFCIIEGRDTVLDFSQMQLQEIRDNVTSRRNKIFLLMEEVRRLRIQQRIKSQEQGVDSKDPTLENEEMPTYPSSIPFLPPLTTATLKQYYATCFALVSIIILFGGLVAPVLELKLGMGGTSYEDFIRQMHLPLQLSEVDPIVASFSGGAVGVISSLMVVEINNVRQQEHKRCRYCHGTGYLACARCSGSGSLIVAEPVASVGYDERPLQEPTTQRCPNCSGAGKVMCPTCLCTGMALASEHDPRIDPFV